MRECVGERTHDEVLHARSRADRHLDVAALDMREDVLDDARFSPQPFAGDENDPLQGNRERDDVRALDSVVKTQGAAIGVLLSIEEPTAKMHQWAATCGDYVSAFNGQKYPRIQLRTIGQLLAGITIQRPSGNVAMDETFKKAPKATAKGHEQQGLGI